MIINKGWRHLMQLKFDAPIINCGINVVTIFFILCYYLNPILKVSPMHAFDCYVANILVERLLVIDV